MKLLSYREAFKILNEKYQIDHNEMRYFSFPRKVESCHVYLTDIPAEEGKPPLYIWTSNINYVPEKLFFAETWVNNFKPPKHCRFVYFRDLPGKRQWSNDNNYNKNILEEAALDGFLSYYDEKSNTFKKDITIVNGSNSNTFNWANSQQGQEYLENSESFYLLYEILTIEHMILNKTLEECMMELKA